LIVVNSNAAWAAAIAFCAGEVEVHLAIDDAVGAAKWALICISKLTAEFVALQHQAAIIAAIAAAEKIISEGGSHKVAVPTPPVPTLATPPPCVTPTGAQHKGLCCAAATQLGLTRASQGFQYTDCRGRVRCAACGTKASVAKTHPGQLVWDFRRLSCGPSGCAALQGQQQPLMPV
jgi:hypothetical protein